MRIMTLTGWGQPHDALAAVAPDATHVDYAQAGNVEEALSLIAEAAASHDMIIGWSLGGQLAVRAVAEKKAKPKRLVLIGAPFQFVKSETSPIGLPRDVHEQFRYNYVTDPARTLARAWELIAKDDREHRKVRAHMGVQDTKKVLGTDWLRWLDMLDGFTCAGLEFSHFPPTLLVHGRADAVVWVEQAQHFAAAIPRCVPVLWKDCGHAPHWHDTEKLKQLIGEYARV